jgi:hypothetical protein
VKALGRRSTHANLQANFALRPQRRDPLHFRHVPENLLEVICAIEGAVGDEVGHAVGGLQRLNVCSDDLAERLRITAMATERFYEHGVPAWGSTINATMTCFRVGVMVSAVALATHGLIGMNFISAWG